jgi:serine/threonine-protein kinase
MASLGTCGNYVLLERIGEGGMAEVFTAKTTATLGVHRVLALKRLLPNLATNRRFVTMFVDEARIAVDLVHDNIVQIYELGVSKGQHYIAMEYVPGCDLADLLDDLAREDRVLPVPHATYIATCVGAALEYAHGRSDDKGESLGIVHRDISPQNVLISYDGAVKVADFGIALAKHRVHHTVGLRLKGKIVYMSPEQAWGGELDERSDIFSLGSVLYRMLTGRLAFNAPRDLDALAMVRSAKITPPRAIRPEIPPQLERIVQRAMARNPGDRFQGAGEMVDALEPFRVVEGRACGARDLAASVKQLSASAAEARRDTLDSLAAATDEAELAGDVPQDWTGVATHQICLEELSESVILAVHRPWLEEEGRRTVKVDPSQLPDSREIQAITEAAETDRTDPDRPCRERPQTADPDATVPNATPNFPTPPRKRTMLNRILVLAATIAVVVGLSLLLLCR